MIVELCLVILFYRLNFRMRQVLFLMLFLLLNHQFPTFILQPLRVKLVAVYIPPMLTTYSLPEKQLSFLLQAGCDTLPTPLNLAHWDIIVSPICSIYSTQVLTGCSTAKGGLFCRLSFTILRRIYHHVTIFMLTFLIPRQYYSTSYYIYP